MPSTKNTVKLGANKPLKDDLSSLNVGETRSSLELATVDNGARVRGDLEVTGEVKPFKATRIISDKSLELDTLEDIYLNATGEDIFFQTGATTYAKLSKTNSQLIFYENGGASTDDYLRIRCVANGETTITTVDAAGSDADLIMDVDGDITLDSQTGVFISKRAGVEFSPANSAYAGMILGYTRIQNDGTSMGEAHITMDGTLTVLQTASGTNVGVTFVAPPSGNVEITFSAVVYASSKTIEFALSDNTTHNEIAETHTYDAGVVSSDETDRNKINVDWAVTGLTAGTSYTYYISGAETVSGTSYIQHGRNRTTGSHYPPIIVKATALPATITTGE